MEEKLKALIGTKAFLNGEAVEIKGFSFSVIENIPLLSCTDGNIASAYVFLNENREFIFS